MWIPGRKQQFGGIQRLGGGGSMSLPKKPWIWHLPAPPAHFFRLSPGTGVTVNALHPGVARTELGRHTGMHSSAFSSFTLGKSPPTSPGR